MPEPVPAVPVAAPSVESPSYPWPWQNPNVHTWLSNLVNNIWIAIVGAIVAYVGTHQPVPVQPAQPVAVVQPATPVVAPVTPPAVEAPAIKLWQPDATGEPGRGAWVSGRVVGPWEKK